MDYTKHTGKMFIDLCDGRECKLMRVCKPCKENNLTTIYYKFLYSDKKHLYTDNISSFVLKEDV